MKLKEALQYNDTIRYVYDEWGNVIGAVSVEEREFIGSRYKKYKKNQDILEKQKQIERKKFDESLSPVWAKYLDNSFKINEEETEPLSDEEILSSDNDQEKSYYEDFMRQPK